MEDGRPDLEVVRVIGLHWLIDSRSRLRTYRRAGGEALEPAYYVVSRPAAEPRTYYDESVGFRGPFADAAEARAAADLMEAEARGGAASDVPALLRPKPLPG